MAKRHAAWPKKLEHFWDIVPGKIGVFCDDCDQILIDTIEGIGETPSPCDEFVRRYNAHDALLQFAKDFIDSGLNDETGEYYEQAHAAIAEAAKEPQ